MAGFVSAIGATSFFPGATQRYFPKYCIRPCSALARTREKTKHVTRASEVRAPQKDPEYETPLGSVNNFESDASLVEGPESIGMPTIPDDSREHSSSLDVENTSGFYVAPVQDYVTVQRPHTSQQPQAASTSGTSAPIDLLELDGAGREALVSGSYSSIVDVNITVGGLLEINDEDNSELFTGVGFDAILENEQLTDNLRNEFSISTATHVQLAAIPRIQQGDDIVMQSHTGTGKTLAFLLPLLESIDTDFPHVQAIVVAPTRELAMQIYGECTRLCTQTDILSMALIGGANPARQIEKLRRRTPHVVIGTPGRLAELEDQRALQLRKVSMLVIDEVDHSLQENFRDSLERLLYRCPKSRQLVLVSATGDVDSVREFATKQMQTSVLLRVGDKQLVPKNITNWYVVVPPRLRIETLRKLMNAEPRPTRAICFVNDPRRVELVVERLYKMKIAAAALRGNAHKMERAEVIKAFRTGGVRLLVTTEVAARGLDVREVSHVFNLDLPTDADHYIHRAGRCGRAGAEGFVVSVAVPETAFVMNRLEKQLKLKITRMEPRDGRYAEPSKHFSSNVSTDAGSDSSKERRSRLDGDHKPKSREVQKGAHSPIGTGGAKKRKDTKLKKDVDDAETPERKPRHKKRHSRARRGQPKVRVSSRDVRIHAKAHGWVGNRASSRPMPPMRPSSED